MLTIYIYDLPGDMPRPALGPGDLEGYVGELAVRGEPTGDQAGRWASALGLAVARGCTVRRIP